MKTNDISRNELDRRAFLGGALAAVGGFILPTPGEIAGPLLAGKPCVRLRIPHPQMVKPDSRVYDFEIELRVDGAGKLTRRVLAKGFNRPEPLAAQTSDCLFGEDEIPAGGKVTFAVRPRNAFGVAGRALEAELPARAG